MKKVLSVLLSLFMIICLAGCQNMGEQTNQPQIEKEEINDSELNFNDISWEAYYGVEDNKRYMLMDIQNNSRFVITKIDFTYTEKDGVTDDERTTFINEWSELSKMDLEKLHDWGYDKIEFSASFDENINPGDLITTHFYYLHGYYYLMNEDHFNLSTPDYAEIDYLADDNKIHTTYYDFRTNKQRFSNEVKDINS